MCWWLEGKPKLIFSQNDSFGGCEAVAHVWFERNDCVGEVRLSRLHKLPNKYVIKGELGAIESSVHFWQSVTVETKSGKKRIKLKCDENRYSDFGNRIVANFLDVIDKREPPLVSGNDVLDSIEFIEECYDSVSRFSLPWYETLEMLNGK
jgi:hypothetical protein